MAQKIIIFFTFYLSLSVQIYAQTINLDSMVLAIEKMPQDTATLRLMVRTGDKISNEDLKKGLYFYQKAYKLAQKLENEFWIPRIEGHLGSNMANLGKADSALIYFHAAQKIYEKQGNNIQLCKIFGKIRWVYDYLGEYDKALEYAFKALKIAEASKDEKNIGICLSDIAWVLSSQDKQEEAIIYAEKAYNIQKEIQDWKEFVISAQALSDFWLRLSNYSKSLDYIEEAIKIQKTLEDENYLAFLLNTRGNVLKYQKKYPEAIADYQYALAFARKKGAAPLEIACISNIGHIYNLMHQYQKALPYHLESYRRIDEKKEANLQIENFRLLSEAYAGVKKYDSAYYFHQLYKTVADSLLGLDNQTRMDELRVKYETEKKEEQISEQNRNLWILGIGLGCAILGGAGLFFLIRQLRKRNKEKDNLLKEKEFLIKEVHHRVKNNLQVLSSLLYLQSRHIKDEAALDAVREGQNRVEAMGLIHQKLYMGNALATVEMKDYLQNLGEMLLDAFGIEDDSVVIDYQVDTMQLDVDTAIPLGLIINELITNSLKYAFPKNETGKIMVALWKNEVGNLCLKVADNGKGIIQTENTSKSTSFGSNLIKVLSQKLKAKPEITKTAIGYSTYIECNTQ